MAYEMKLKKYRKKKFEKNFSFWALTGDKLATKSIQNLNSFLKFFLNIYSLYLS